MRVSIPNAFRQRSTLRFMGRQPIIRCGGAGPLGLNVFGKEEAWSRAGCRFPLQTRPGPLGVGDQASGQFRLALAAVSRQPRVLCSVAQDFHGQAEKPGQNRVVVLAGESFGLARARGADGRDCCAVQLATRGYRWRCGLAHLAIPKGGNHAAGRVLTLQASGGPRPPDVAEIGGIGETQVSHFSPPGLRGYGENRASGVFCVRSVYLDGGCASGCHAKCDGRFLLRGCVGCCCSCSSFYNLIPTNGRVLLPKKQISY